MTIHYTVTEQKIDSLKNYAIYIRHFNMAIGILLGTFITLVLVTIWDKSHLGEKITVFFVISAFLMWLLYLKRKTQSKIERIWQYIKKASEGVNEET
ncbi:hypothetical protein m07a_10700 [Bartonella schoenbuchensis m07a]|uniref:Uncharacterized protein n=1 Tax=Bartonella schoenbuchensis m07a TaxID=1094496 RepID=N6VCR8_9HYPH|nr:hypothetical protein m07a_10700 [Bartonella schoenbuchensis m07a]